MTEKRYAWINNKGYIIKCGCDSEWGTGIVQQCVAKARICKKCQYMPWFEPPQFTEHEPIVITERQYLEEITR